MSYHEELSYVDSTAKDANSRSKDAIKRIIDLEKEVKQLKEQFSKFGADKEYRMMHRLGSLYTPPKTFQKKECDFTEIADILFCSNCHNDFFIEDDFIPPYCPYCFAKYKREEVD